MENAHFSESESSVISLRLAQYDDIFSDFDIRPYSSRSLSVDFLDELKRAARDKKGEGGGIELVLYVPKQGRRAARDTTIKERLMAHFKKHHHLLLQEKRHVTKLGMRMCIAGFLCMIAATTIVFIGQSRNLLLSFLIVFFEPPAWFLVWEGMDQILFKAKSTQQELEFYRIMSNSNGHITFKSY